MARFSEHPAVKLILFTLQLGMVSCAGAVPNAASPSEQSIDFSYTIKGESRSLAALRGRPVALVLIRTSELPSHLHVREVAKAFRRAAGRTRFLILTIEPGEQPFLDPFVEAEELPFPIGVAEWNVALGNTGLGQIPTVPTTYLIDPEGRVVNAAAGLVPADDLVRAIEKLASR